MAKKETAESPQLKKMREAAKSKSNGAAKPAKKASAKKAAKKASAKKAPKKAAKKGKRVKKTVNPAVAAKRKEREKAAKAKAKAEKGKKEPAEKKAKKPKASSGQCGPALKLEADALNPKERKVLATLVSANKPLKLGGIAEATFKSLGPIKGNSHVRNSLRRLARAGLVRKTGTGTYVATPKGKGEKDEIKAEVKAAAPKVKQVLANA